MRRNDTKRYRLLALTARDLAMLGEWLRSPHMVEWWGEPNTALDEIREAMDSASTEPFIVELDERPIAYLHWYDPHMEEDHPYRDQPPGTLGFDLSIGIADLLDAGHGSAMLRQAVDEQFKRGIPRAIIDPDPKNRRAIRAYEKAGFRPVERRTTTFGDVLLMARDAPARGQN